MRSGLILGQTNVRKRILVPPGYASEQRIAFRCTVPGCRAGFTDDQGELFQRHVGRCAREHADEIRAAMRPKGSAIFHEDFDPELSKHMRGVGETMLKEGRWEVLPHERAGL